MYFIYAMYGAIFALIIASENSILKLLRTAMSKYQWRLYQTSAVRNAHVFQGCTMYY